MSLIMGDKNPKHMPDGAFSFDEEVASIFDDMAYRSIPGYNETHRLNVSISMPYIMDKHRKGESVAIMDVGSSTGKFFEELETQMSAHEGSMPDWLTCMATDTSTPMLAQLVEKLPWVSTRCFDITQPLPPQWQGAFDIVNLSYVLQFIKTAHRENVCHAMFRLLKPGGLLFLSSKDEAEGPFAKEFEGQYFQWRMNNGYTMEEVSAKTTALKESMWLDAHHFTVRRLQYAGFKHVTLTTRWLQFSSLVAMKP